MSLSLCHDNNVSTLYAIGTHNRVLYPSCDQTLSATSHKFRDCLAAGTNPFGLENDKKPMVAGRSRGWSINQRPHGRERHEHTFRANSESRLMKLFLSHFRFWGTTLEHIFLAKHAFGSIEPAALAAILSSNFQDYDMGPRRKPMSPSFGDGIFTQGDTDWRHSRALMRSQFLHRQYDDLKILREPVNDLVEAMSITSVVDLQPYW